MYQSADLLYTIFYENDGTAPAQVVTITSSPPFSQLDIRSFRLHAFGIGGLTYVLPASAQAGYYGDRVDYTAQRDCYVDVLFGVDVQSGQLLFTFTTIDPATGEQPIANVSAGFLPPNVPAANASIGVGWVSFVVRPLPTTSTGDVVSVEASIIFDQQPPLATNIVSNTIDAGDIDLALLNITVSGSQLLLTLGQTSSSVGAGIAAGSVSTSTGNGSFTPAGASSLSFGVKVTTSSGNSSANSSQTAGRRLLQTASYTPSLTTLLSVLTLPLPAAGNLSTLPSQLQMVSTLPTGQTIVQTLNLPTAALYASSSSISCSAVANCSYPNGQCVEVNVCQCGTGWTASDCSVPLQVVPLPQLSTANASGAVGSAIPLYVFVAAGVGSPDGTTVSVMLAGLLSAAWQVYIGSAVSPLPSSGGQVSLGNAVGLAANTIRLVAPLDASTGITTLQLIATAAEPGTVATATATAPLSVNLTTLTNSSSLPTSAWLCLLFYSLSGTPDYPWSAAVQLTVHYLPNPLVTANGTAVQLVSATGTRTYTNKFGQPTTVDLSLLATGAAGNNDNLLYLVGSLPFSSGGIAFALGTSQTVTLPGNAPTVQQTQLSYFQETVSLASPTAATIVRQYIAESGSTRIDPSGSAFLSSIPGFTNVTIGGANANIGAVQYGKCSAPITFSNGLRTPIIAGTFNGAQHVQFNYFISDGFTYSITCNLTLTMANAVAANIDALGNQYQQVVGVTGTRVYTYLPTNAAIVSAVSTVSNGANGFADQRFYPFALLGSAAAVYTVNTAPFLDYDGIEFNISPGTPAAGEPPSTGTIYTATNVHMEGRELSPVLVDGYFYPSSSFTSSGPTGAPLLALQQQSYDPLSS